MLGLKVIKGFAISIKVQLFLIQMITFTLEGTFSSTATLRLSTCEHTLQQIFKHVHKLSFTLLAITVKKNVFLVNLPA